MEINTKYNVDDELWFMFNNKVIKGKVSTINIMINTIGPIIKYRMEYANTHPYSYIKIKTKILEERKVFKNQEELLNSLKV